MILCFAILSAFRNKFVYVKTIQLKMVDGVSAVCFR